ncbi:hypothetical protein Hanom_Chr17g01570321 [Helianthus anomalus]
MIIKIKIKIKIKPWKSNLLSPSKLINQPPDPFFGKQNPKIVGVIAAVVGFIAACSDSVQQIQQHKV